MDTKEHQKRSEKLIKLIKDLSVSQSTFSSRGKFNEFYTRLQGIYLSEGEQSFRHLYNDIFSVVTEIDSDDKASIDILGENIRMLYQHCMSKSNEKLNEAVTKLYDHISLDIARLKYIKAVDRRVDDTGNNLYAQIDMAQKEFRETKREFDEAKETIDDTSKKINNAYSEFVSILGIFSAIVLVFFGGTSIFGNISSVLQSNGLYVALVVLLVAGVIVFDLIFMFIYFLAKLLDRNISASSEPVYWKNLMERFRDRYPIVFCVNMVVFIGLYVIAVVWSINKLVEADSIGYISAMCGKYNLQIENIEICIIIGLFGIYFNITFLFAYVLSKISNVNIGRYICLMPLNTYRIEKEKIFTYVVNDFEYGTGKPFKWKWCAYLYALIANICSYLYFTICKLVKKIFFRYPYFAIVNVFLGLALVLLS